jgi:hypothetical protein
MGGSSIGVLFGAQAIGVIANLFVLWVPKTAPQRVILVGKTETYSLKRKELCGGLRRSVLW